MDLAVQLSCRAYGLLLLLYPHDFRREFAAEMSAVFKEEFVAESFSGAGQLDHWVWVAGGV